jgi:hypothetical protein
MLLNLKRCGAFGEHTPTFSSRSMVYLAVHGKAKAYDRTNIDRKAI